MDMYLAVYIEVNILSIILLLLIYFRGKQENDRQSATLAYERVILATVSVLLLDAAWAMVEGRQRPGFNILNYIINILYMIDTGFVNYLWMRFVFIKLRAEPKRRSLTQLLLLLPLLSLALMCASTPWTGWLFTVGPGNSYARGPLLILQRIICYSYVFIATGLSLLRACKETNRDRRSEALTLCSFVVLPMIGAMGTVLVEGFPSTWPFASLSLMLVYLNLQSLQISTDELTGLNNRRQFDRNLAAQTESSHREKRLFLLLLDVDGFKSINDSFGHAAGDRALVIVADILKQVCGSRSGFLARFGGDEFAIITEVTSSDELDALRAELDAAFTRFNLSGAEPYTLTVSVGVGEYSSDAASPEAIFALADKALYSAKAEKKLGR